MERVNRAEENIANAVAQRDGRLEGKPDQR